MKSIYNRLYRLIQSIKADQVLAWEGNNVYTSTPVIEDAFIGEWVHDVQLRTKILDLIEFTHVQWRIRFRVGAREIVVMHLLHSEYFYIGFGTWDEEPHRHGFEVEKVERGLMHVRFFSDGMLMNEQGKAKLRDANRMLGDWIASEGEIVPY
jgi:hypothetical protein